MFGKHILAYLISYIGVLKLHQFVVYQDLWEVKERNPHELQRDTVSADSV